MSKEFAINNNPLLEFVPNIFSKKESFSRSISTNAKSSKVP